MSILKCYSVLLAPFQLPVNSLSDIIPCLYAEKGINKWMELGGILGKLKKPATLVQGLLKLQILKDAVKRLESGTKIRLGEAASGMLPPGFNLPSPELSRYA